MSDNALDPVAATQSGHPGVDQWNTLINLIAPKYAVPPNLLKAHMLYESGGDAKVVSFDQGCGLCQITSGVELVKGVYTYFGVDILDPTNNITAACKNFIRPAIDAFPGNLNAVIAAYNAGIGAVQHAIAIGHDPSTVTYDPMYVPHVRGAYDWFCTQAHNAHKC